MFIRALSQRVALLRGHKAKIQRYLRRRGTCIRPDEISSVLQSFGRFSAPVLMVHSSLSSCGQIEGGAESVIEALRAWLRPASLAMPTHSYCYPHGDAPAPCFDLASTPSVVGAITDLFWRQAGVIRSLHPTHSLACEGSLAQELCVGHDLTETPCGKGTPYERLVQCDSAVLMIGVTLDSYTLFHTAEDAAAVPYLYEARKYELTIKEPCGAVRPFPMFRQDMNVVRRFAAMETWLEDRGLLVRRKLGLGELLYLPHAAAVHKAVVEELDRDPCFLIAESGHPKPERPLHSD